MKELGLRIGQEKVSRRPPFLSGGLSGSVSQETFRKKINKPWAALRRPVTNQAGVMAAGVLFHYGRFFFLGGTFAHSAPNARAPFFGLVFHSISPSLPPPSWEER